MLQSITSVGSLAKGSTNAVSGIGNDEHVRFVDRLPAANGRAVKPQALLESVQLDAMAGNGEMLLHAGKIHEAQIDGLDFLLLDELEHVRRSFRRVHKSPHFF